jgi:hypothetical protein
MLIAGLGSIACCAEDKIVPLKVQSIHITRANSPETFVERWLPLSEMPKRVRVIPIVVQTKGELRDEDAEDAARLSVAPDRRNNDLGRQDVAQVEHTTLPRSRPRNIRYTYKRDQRTCVRHGMKTVYYGKHRWRCRHG